MASDTPPARGKRGRPPKFGAPAQVVALTLPDDVIRGLRRINPDIAWAIVSVYEQHSTRDRPRRPAGPDSALVWVGPRQALIVVPGSLKLPGVNVIPLHGDRAFLALEPGCGVADLEIAVIDRLEEQDLDPDERRSLTELRALLRQWRRDPRITFRPRSIIVVERRRRT